jgi:hypothetical protein
LSLGGGELPVVWVVTTNVDVVGISVVVTFNVVVD